MLTALRKICNHPALYKPAADEEAEEAEEGTADEEDGGCAGEVADFNPDQSGGANQILPSSAQQHRCHDLGQTGGAWRDWLSIGFAATNVHACRAGILARLSGFSSRLAPQARWLC